MANLFFPQLTSGALAQYPINRTRIVRTVKNVLAGGDMVLYPDSKAGHLVWKLDYTELSNVDLAALQNHFAACSGPYRAFTFLDPTGNLLEWTSDLTHPVWRAPASLAVAGGVASPYGDSAAFTLTNNGQISQAIAQTLAIPAAYQYIFSVYVQSAQGASVTLSRSGQNASAIETFAAGPNWLRISTGGTLQDSTPSVTIGLAISAGQEVNVYAPQLEAQIAPSRARLTGRRGGVYPNAHWGVNSLPVIATAPGLFTTSFTIEAGI